MTQPIFLYGPPASGKSTLARSLGEMLGLKVLDTDAMVEEKAGISIAEIFASKGEAAFRSLENVALAQAVLQATDTPSIIALGGGTLLREENRRLAEQSGNVICLDPPSDEELKRRLLHAQSIRPLGDKSHERALHYASFHRHLATSFTLPNSMVLVGTGLADILMQSSRTVFEEFVAQCYPQLSKQPLAIIPTGEIYKTPETVMKLWHAFAVAGIGRKDLVMACGGGVTGDLTGFAAATWMRGIPWFNFPTTLLAMVDASTGGKTGCDLPDGKNLAGAFHSPRLVVIDTLFLESLPERELRAGRAEMLKHQVIQGPGPSPLQVLSAKTIADNLAVKVKIVREDPFETNGRRMLLNCGHTVAHALEQTMNYTISHGEAVAIGCVEEAREAVRRGLAPEKWPDELAECFRAAGLPVALPQGVSFQSLTTTMMGDKKRQKNSVTFALPCGWGDVRLVKLELS